MSRLKRVAIFAGLGFVLVGGTGAAYLLRARRDVTTSSEEAYRYYRLGRDNQLKMYEREAVEAYAQALKNDPHFVLATVRLSELIRGRDPERAKSLIACVARFRDEVTPREELLLSLTEAQLAGQSEKIDQLLDKYAQRYPDDPEGYHLRAMRLMRKGKDSEAVSEFERLLKANPNFAIVYNNLGYHAAKLGDFAKAEDYLKRYRFLAPDQANPYDSLGEIYANTGRYEEAVESLKKAQGIKPDFWPAEAHLGTLEVARGDYAAASQHYHRASELMDGGSASQAEFEIYSIFSLAFAGNTEDARKRFEALEASVKSGSESDRKRLEPMMLFNKAALLAKTGHADEAEPMLESAIKARAAAMAGKPVDKKGYDEKWAEREIALVRGLIAKEQGKLEAAVGFFQTAVVEHEDMMGGFDYFPGHALCRVLMADSLRQLGRFGEAEDALKPLLTRNPRFAAAAQVMAKVREGDSGAADKRTETANAKS